MKIKTSDLTGAALDWAVAKIEQKKMLDIGLDVDGTRWVFYYDDEAGGNIDYAPSTDPAQAWPIIERERITVSFMDEFDGWSADIVREHGQDRKNYTDDQDRDSYATTQESFCSYGPTPLIAAMRCFIASRLGDEVDVPEELLS